MRVLHKWQLTEHPLKGRVIPNLLPWKVYFEARYSMSRRGLRVPVVAARARQSTRSARSLWSYPCDRLLAGVAGRPGLPKESQRRLRLSFNLMPNGACGDNHFFQDTFLKRP